MSFIFNISALFFLMVLVYQDFKSRQISLWPVILLFINLFLLSYIQNGVKQAFFLFSINFLFTAVELLFIFIFLKLRKKINFFSEINHFFGWGDVLFLVSISAAFSPMNYIFFSFAGAIVCILFVLFKAWFSGSLFKDVEVPFAGVLAGCLVLLFTGNLFIRTFNFYDDLFLLHLLNE